MNVLKYMYFIFQYHCNYQPTDYWVCGLMSRVFSNSQEDWGSIPGQVIPKTQRMVLDAALVNTQHFKARIKGKVEKSREWSSVLPYTLV